ncbi:MAG: energy-coupling factor transporter ATPase [Candidatus Wallbacteria bacterium]|nr:energy-coupling factor transporter ATPase [Candidatus Wallbacteria bacterium]
MLPRWLLSSWSVIEVKNLKFSYKEDGPLALKGVDFFMNQGELVALLGGNGSGKSTFVKVLNGLAAPFCGEVKVFGISPSDQSRLIEIRRRLGMVFQNPENQIVGAIVEDDVAFSLENIGLGREEIRSRVDQALALTGLEGKRKARTSELSGGQQQRLAICSILALRPEAIIFDEATSMLDPESREEIFQLILRLNREEKMGVLFITHFMEEAVHADRAVLMRSGTIAADGKPGDVFNREDLLRKCELELPEAKSVAHELQIRGVDIEWRMVLKEEDLLTEVKKRVSFV